MNDRRTLPPLSAVAAPAPAAPTIAPVPLRQVLPWLLFAALLALVAMYFVGAEQGATSLLNGTAVHEWTHDGRHLLGFPCH
jgi:cobalt transporter subunit CbtB